MKPFWNIDRVYQLTGKNVEKYLAFLYQEDGKPYDSLYSSAKTYFGKAPTSDYFGQIITNYNFLGFIQKDAQQIFHINPLAKYLAEHKELINYFLEYVLLKLQFPRPNISDDRRRDISKPFLLVLKVLIMLREQGGEDEAYLTEEEFSFLFGNNIKSSDQIDSRLINNTLANRRALAGANPTNRLANDLSYSRALFLNSRLLTANEAEFPSAKSKFHIGLKKGDWVYYLSRFILSHYKNTVFKFDPSVSKSDVVVSNKWSKYISNKKDFFEFLDLFNMIDNIQPFREYALGKGYYFDDELIRRFITSLISKRYLILTGISGSGKSKIAELYGKFLKESEKGDFLLKAVGSNWNDNKSLLGFVNPLIQNGDQYQRTDVVEFVRKANANPDKTFVLLLDEMNLSYTERYFSDFLSALESLDNEISLPDGSVVKWTANLKLIGTINEDETTHTLSPKVIDRANIIEMNGSLPSAYLDLLKDKENAGMETLFEKPWVNDYKEILNELYRATNGNFGYRVMNEITDYVVLNWNYKIETDFRIYLDDQVYQKILPKIHGSRADVRGKIDALIELLQPQADFFSQSLGKLEKMRNQLQNSGFTSFINS